MPATSWGYRAAVRVGAMLAPAIGLVDRKMGDGDRGRRGAADRLAAWAAAHRDRARPLAWFHAASVGEGLQAESVLLQYRRLVPECQLVYTHFSPSAETLARRLAVDAADYLPYDLPGSVDRVLAALEPDLVVFAKLDLWPELATRAATARDDRGHGGRHRRAKAAAASAGRRGHWPARAMVRWTPLARSPKATPAASVAWVCGRDRIRVLGDPRFDSVAARVAAIPPDEPLLRYGRGAATLVAGSTWPPDERVLLEAFAQVRHRFPDARLILVPHEPTGEHLAALDRRAGQCGLPAPVRLSAADGPAPLLVVDRVGVLATLYGAGGMAYVGGGFGRAGLHSVLEPAAWGVPVAFGPRWRDSRDAALLLEAGAARALDDKSSAGLLAEIWVRWIGDEPGRAAAGHQARDIVARGQGAARRAAEMLAGLTSSRPLRR